MYSLKGFVSFISFCSNNPGIISKIGELSPQSYTYAKEKGYYTSNDNKDINLISFLSKQDDVLVKMPDDVNTSVFTLLNWLYVQMTTSSNTQDRTELLISINNTFASSIEELVAGEVVTNGQYYIPEWLSWKIKGTEQFIHIWFTDESFKAQYDEFEIVVIPPMTNLDNFFLQASEVDARMQAMTTTIMVDKLQQAKGDYPETVIKVETFNYIAPGNPTFKVPTRWGVLIYGAAGNNIDSIKDALVNYILSNSTHTRQEWVDLIPDLFKRTEFIFTPLWNQYAIPNRVLEAGIYSPLAKVPNLSAIAKQTATKYPPAHVDNYLSVFGHTYKSLAVLIVGGNENRDNKFYFTDFYSDFISVNTSSIDFNRMSDDTQIVANAIAEMIYLAETANKYTVLPFGYTKLVRDNILYIVKTMNNIQMLIVAKSNFS